MPKFRGKFQQNSHRIIHASQNPRNHFPAATSNFQWAPMPDGDKLLRCLPYMAVSNSNLLLSKCYVNPTKSSLISIFNNGSLNSRNFRTPLVQTHLFTLWKCGSKQTPLASSQRLQSPSCVEASKLSDSISSVAAKIKPKMQPTHNRFIPFPDIDRSCGGGSFHKSDSLSSKSKCWKGPWLKGENIPLQCVGRAVGTNISCWADLSQKLIQEVKITKVPSSQI